MFLTMTGQTIQSLKYTFRFSQSLLTPYLPFYALIDSCGGGITAVTVPAAAPGPVSGDKCLCASVMAVLCWPGPGLDWWW